MGRIDPEENKQINKQTNKSGQQLRNNFGLIHNSQLFPFLFFLFSHELRKLVCRIGATNRQTDKEGKERERERAGNKH